MWPFKSKISIIDEYTTPSEFLQEEITDTFVPNYFGAKHSAPLHDASVIKNSFKSSPWPDLTLLKKSNDNKKAIPWFNVANKCKDWVETNNLPMHDGVWYTGSKIWSKVYWDMTPNITHDTDIYCESYRTFCSVMTQMNWWGHSYQSKDWNRSIGNNGTLNIKTTGRKFIPSGDARFQGGIDIWYPLDESLSVVDMLKAYPSESHSHCRAAYSPTQGLVILPNENAGKI